MTAATVVKYVAVSGIAGARANRARIESRLRRLVEAPLPNVPKLHRYGWLDDTLRIECDRISGATTLDKVANSMNQSLRIRLAAELERIVAQWRKLDFVHGDISHRNILIDSQWDTDPGSGSLNLPRDLPWELPRIWFVDWLLDLDSRQGTPSYASPDVYKGRHTFGSDYYALLKVNERWLLQPF